MICEMCNEREATVHIKKIINDNIEKLHLCDDCAVKQGLSPFKEPSKMTIAELLSSISNITQPQEETSGSGGALKCERCGYTFADFQKKGKLGCAECFVHFRKNLLPILRKVHGATKHSGKTPSYQGKILELRDKITHLKTRMKQAADQENYEEAAKLRDEIYKIEKDLIKAESESDKKNA